jgi:hypothetical protein
VYQPIRIPHPTLLRAVSHNPIACGEDRDRDQIVGLTPGFLLHQRPDVGMILTQRVRLRRAWAEGQWRCSSS